jgi:signal transduction histidine kinase/ligand-binding sensor domain-containing protein
MRTSKFIKVVFVLFCCVMNSVISSAQEGSINFDHYSLNEGLSNGYINNIFQDSRGFVWVGTENGLNRFDGIKFKTYYYDQNDSSSLSGPDANFITEDTCGRIWVMTNRNFCWYDKNTDSFVRKQLKVRGQVIKKLSVSDCQIDRNGFLWIGSANGIFRIKIYNNPDLDNAIVEAEEYRLEEEDVDEVYRNVYSSFVEDNDGKLWIVSYSNKLFYFDPILNKIVSYRIDNPDAPEFSNQVKGFFKDSDGDMYIAINNVGLLVWERQKNLFSLYKPNGTDSGPRGNILSAVAEDNNGLIWISDRNSEGISIFNKVTRKFTYCQSEEMNPYSLDINKINCMYKDRTGSMWVGSIMGVNKYTPGKLKFIRYFSFPNRSDKLSSNHILCFAESRSGDLWIGTDGGGLNRMNRKTGRFTQYRHNPSDIKSISSNSIISISEDHEGTLWIGTYDGGLARMKDGEFSRFLPDPDNWYSISNRNIWYALEDSKKNLWVATLTSGLDLFDRKNGRFYHYINNPADSISICDNSLIQLYEDSRHQLYITTNNGVSVIDLNAYDFSDSAPALKFKNLLHSENKNSISNNVALCIKEDNHGNIWFGTKGSGLDKLDITTGIFTNYSLKDGLPGNSINSILLDNDGNLWLGTDKGLAKFNPETKDVEVFSIEDGILNTSLKSKALKTRDGEMFFGGPDGFNSFYPEQVKFKQNKNKPHVIITGFNIFNKPVRVNSKFDNRIILSEDISVAKEVTLTYSEKYFSFDFIALDYTSPKNNKYAYMMEGFDHDWINCGTKREANYTNLGPGDYTFMVKGSNNEGIWNENFTSIKIIILPPWYRTWWFRLIMILIIIFVFAATFFLRVRKLKKQKLLLEQTVAIKTAELTLLNASKDKFFSIIAHDLKNPFSSIIGFSSIMQESPGLEDISEYKLFSSKIHSSATQTYRLLENLLEWANSQSRKIKFTPVAINLKELIHNEFDLLHEMAIGKNIDLRFNIDDSLFIVADKNMIMTIMRNLITNAIKFTQRNGKVVVEARIYDGNIEVAVKDTGIGMSEDTMSKLFLLDSDLSAKGTENEKGTGLGLFLCKEFVEKHNGKISVESKEGKGSTFRFSIPALISEKAKI